MTMKKLLRLLVSLTLLSNASVWASNTGSRQIVTGNDEEQFVFVGKCETGEPYRLFWYQKDVSGFIQSFYDYEGPNGKGTVQVETTPKVMAARVCRKMAEIINTNYWE